MLAQEEVRRLGQDSCGTEHIFLGLVGLGKGVASDKLKKGGITLSKARKAVEEMLAPSYAVAVKRPWWQNFFGPFKEIPFTPRAKLCVEFAWDEAQKLRVDYIGTEHLLLALIRLAEENKFEMLRRLNLDSSKLRESLIAAIKPKD